MTQGTLGREVTAVAPLPQLAYNSITVEGALALVEVVGKTPGTALEEINICVSAMDVG